MKIPGPPSSSGDAATNPNDPVTQWTHGCPLGRQSAVLCHPTAVTTALRATTEDEKRVVPSRPQSAVLCHPTAVGGLSNQTVMGLFQGSRRLIQPNGESYFQSKQYAVPARVRVPPTQIPATAAWTVCRLWMPARRGASISCATNRWCRYARVNVEHSTQEHPATGAVRSHA